MSWRLHVKVSLVVTRGFIEDEELENSIAEPGENNIDRVSRVLSNICICINDRSLKIVDDFIFKIFD